MNKTIELCPTLDYKSFERIFGSVSESEHHAEDANKKDLVRWYAEKGKEKFRQLSLLKFSSWSDLMGKRLGLKRPDDIDSEEFEEYLAAMDNWEDSPNWLESAKRTIRDDLGVNMFEFVGQGSVKVCLYAKCGLALKFGRNGDSLREEIENNIRFAKYSCIPRMYGYDETNMSSYLCEFARESVSDDFMSIYGVDNAMIFFDMVKAGIRFPKNIGAIREKCICEMRDMIKKLGLIDVSSEVNLGLVVRDGVRQIILIDYDL